jgi:hypothetical protein
LLPFRSIFDAGQGKSEDASARDGRAGSIATYCVQLNDFLYSHLAAAVLRVAVRTWSHLRASYFSVVAAAGSAHGRDSDRLPRTFRTGHHAERHGGGWVCRNSRGASPRLLSPPLPLRIPIQSRIQVRVQTGHRNGGSSERVSHTSFICYEVVCSDVCCSR